MKTIELSGTPGGLCLVDDEDFERYGAMRWRSVLWYGGTRLYVATKIRVAGKQLDVFLHRLVMLAPKGVQVDHRNMDTLDNRKENLRYATHSQNQMNVRARHGSSRFKGVTWNANCGRWQASIKMDGRSRYLGLFDDEAEAAAAYDTAAKSMFGSFARLNFPVAT